jgi:hypothetical protein
MELTGGAFSCGRIVLSPRPVAPNPLGGERDIALGAAKNPGTVSFAEPSSAVGLMADESAAGREVLPLIIVRYASLLEPSGHSLHRTFAATSGHSLHRTFAALPRRWRGFFWFSASLRIQQTFIKGSIKHVATGFLPHPAMSLSRPALHAAGRGRASTPL